jgi:hypothetical protein
MAGIFLLIGTGQLITFPGGGPVSKWLELGIGVLGILLGTGYLMSAIALRRGERRTPDSATGQEANSRS